MLPEGNGEPQRTKSDLGFQDHFSYGVKDKREATAMLQGLEGESQDGGELEV
jgi:hypothetical protein